MESELLSFLELHAQEALPLQAHDAVANRDKDVAPLPSRDQTSWTADDTARALKDCPHDEFLGLKFYHEDPLPWIRKADSELSFVDYEFPVNKPVMVNGTRIEPGIITESNFRDFQGTKRSNRINHYMANAENSWVWVRASSMKQHSLFSSGESSIDPRNVLQGAVGNCGFCSGFASLACDFPHVLRDAFGEHSATCVSECGACSVRLYPQGQERYILMDDFVLCRNDSDSSPSLNSHTRRDLWIRFLEKAFVKIQGSYASLDGYYKYKSLYRHPARALQLLTGAPLAMEVHYSTSTTDMVYDMLLASQGICARVVHCRKQVCGLRSNHGYSLLWVGEATGVKLVCLRNPHGRGSYRGQYGFGLRAGWKSNCEVASSLLLLGCFVQCPKTKRVTWNRVDGEHAQSTTYPSRVDNGIFFMEFSAFVECFPITTMVGPIKLNGLQVQVSDCVHKMNEVSLHPIRSMLMATRTES